MGADTNVNKKTPEPMIKIPCYGKYAPTLVRMNSTHIEVTGAYCTCGKEKWGRKGTRVFENDVRFTSNNQKIPKGKNFKILVNPKMVSDGEFTVVNWGTRYSDMDLCCACGSEKMWWKKFYMKRLK